MSGIYLIVWDTTLGVNSKALLPTKGGWPHLTLAYTGKLVDAKELRELAGLVAPRTDFGESRCQLIST